MLKENFNFAVTSKTQLKKAIPEKKALIKKIQGINTASAYTTEFPKYFCRL